MSKASGFIWRREEEMNLTQSIRSLDMHAGDFSAHRVTGLKA